MNARARAVSSSRQMRSCWTSLNINYLITTSKPLIFSMLFHFQISNFELKTKKRKFLNFFSHPRLLNSFNFIQMRLNKSQKFLNLKLLKRLGSFTFVDVAVIEIFVDNSSHCCVVFGEEVHSIAPVFHLLELIF